jgi:hypothetical protein
MDDDNKNRHTGHSLRECLEAEAGRQRKIHKVHATSAEHPVAVEALVSTLPSHAHVHQRCTREEASDG